MEIDELSYNYFYLLLRNEYRKKYDLALTKCWTICVPCGDSLREVPITKEFVDDHVLRPLPARGRFASTDEAETHHLYRIENRRVISIDEGDDDDDGREGYGAKILSIEKGYNKEFQPYSIVVLDRPLRRKYRPKAARSGLDTLELNRSVTSYKEAIKFLKDLPIDKSCALDDMIVKAESINVAQYIALEDIKQILQKLIRDHWAGTMRCQRLDVQRDARFQKLLSVSLEIFVLHHVHDSLYALLANFFVPQDTAIKAKIDELNDIGATPGQLGARDKLAEVPLPGAIVELAALDSQKGPFERLMCLKGTLDFMIAEIKGALAATESKTAYLNDSDGRLESCIPDTDDLIPLLLYVIVKCRCQRLHTDLYYIENFNWSISPHDGLSYTLVMFKTALVLLEQINVNELVKRRKKTEVEDKMTNGKLDPRDVIKDCTDALLLNMREIET